MNDKSLNGNNCDNEDKYGCDLIESFSGFMGQRKDIRVIFSEISDFQNHTDTKQIFFWYFSSINATRLPKQIFKFWEYPTNCNFLASRRQLFVIQLFLKTNISRDLLSIDYIDTGHIVNNISNYEFIYWKAKKKKPKINMNSSKSANQIGRIEWKL